MRSYAERLAEFAWLLRPIAQRNASLASHSLLGIGGMTDVLVFADSEAELLAALAQAGKLELPVRVFGSLTNCLLPAAPLRGVTILNQMSELYFEDEYRLRVAAGTSAARVARAAVRRGWDGLTWATGLPGTVGGMVVNNAGAFGGTTSDLLLSAEIVSPAGIQTVDAEWFDFQYRSSRLKVHNAAKREIVLWATFQLREGGPAQLQARAAEYKQRRLQTQPPGRSLGCVFANPPGDYAGRLIEAAGLKGERRGDVMISPQHANFFINQGQGTAAEYLELIQLVQTEVRRQFGTELELEIEIV
ncbi:MAG TPA: UDP-N-acetylmuramate dehydrogenase [Thermoflexia bacterium]|nr:UDP-N-acetylmuramate dehydrogenase [Thermoflexia bacterium]